MENIQLQNIVTYVISLKIRKMALCVEPCVKRKVIVLKGFQVKLVLDPTYP